MAADNVVERGPEVVMESIAAENTHPALGTGDKGIRTANEVLAAPQPQSAEQVCHTSRYEYDLEYDAKFGESLT